MAKGCYIVQNALCFGPEIRYKSVRGEGSVNGIGQGMGMWTYSDSVWGLDLLDLQLHEKNSRLPPNFLHFFALDGGRRGVGGSSSPSCWLGRWSRGCTTPTATAESEKV